MKNKILIITPKFYPSIGGIEEQVMLLGVNFINKGYKVDILIYNNETQTIQSELFKGMNIYRFSNISSYFYYLLKNKNNYNMIISRQYYKNSFCLSLLKLFKILKSKTILIGDGGTKKNEIEILQNKLGVLSKLYFYIIGKNNFLVGNNKYFINSLKKYFQNDKIYKIYNGINIDNYNHRKIKEIKNILYISRFDEGKGFIETIQAFKKIKNPDILLNLVGYGNLEIENKIKNIIHNDKRILYHGKKYGEEKNNLLLKSDLFVFPTSYVGESFGVVLYEAVKYNIPIITTDFGDTKEIFSDNIFYVKNNDISDLEMKIKWIIKNIDNFSYNYSNIIKQIDINNIADQILKLK